MKSHKLPILNTKQMCGNIDRVNCSQVQLMSFGVKLCSSPKVTTDRNLIWFGFSGKWEKNSVWRTSCSSARSFPFNQIYQLRYGFKNLKGLSSKTKIILVVYSIEYHRFYGKYVLFRKSLANWNAGPPTLECINFFKNKFMSIVYYLGGLWQTLFYNCITVYANNFTPVDRMPLTDMQQMWCSRLLIFWVWYQNRLDSSYVCVIWAPACRKHNKFLEILTKYAIDPKVHFSFRSIYSNCFNNFSP